jgi:EAL domain-containing protein (putative c-di-GMP-specific phosphodiesterase class I)
MIAERILDAFRQPFFLESQSGRAIRIGASIGIATGARGSAQEMLRDADVALYQAKALGKGRYEIFRSEMRRSVTDAVEMKAELYAADTNNEFFPVYQPILDLETLEVTGVEALLRWNHPDRGLLLPGQFLPALEESGMIVEIGRLVLQKACAQLAKWHEQKMLLSMSVNVSARQLDSNSLIAAVKEALAANGLAPSFLVLEVTESAVMLNLGDAAKRLRALKSLGLKLAIDDFGTGYSSLAYVQQLPVDVLKIDRSFVSRLGISRHASTLVRSVVELATALGLTTVAEGIESQAQYDELRSIRADSGQGYLFSHPLEVGVFEDLVRIDSRTGKVYMTDGPDRYPLTPRTSTDDASEIDSAGPAATASLGVE